MVGRMNGHQPRIVSVARRGDDEPLFPRLDAVRPTISQREMLRRANAARDEPEARAIAARWSGRCASRLEPARPAPRWRPEFTPVGRRWSPLRAWRWSARVWPWHCGWGRYERAA